MKKVSCDKSTYFAVLNGADTDLCLLYSLFQNGNIFNIVAVSDDDGVQYQIHSDRFILSTDIIREEENWQFIEKETYGAIKLMNGAAKLIQSNFLPIRIDSFHKISQKNSENIAIQRPTTKEKKYEVNVSDNIMALTQEWVKYGYHNDNVSFVLQVYGNVQSNWASLRSIFETIQNDIGGEIALRKRRWLSVEQIRNLKIKHEKQTKICGNSIYTKSVSMRQNSKKTSFLEAEESVQQIINMWLSEKIGTIQKHYIANL